jgi:outer membrane biosynthesis protein TonB
MMLVSGREMESDMPEDAAEVAMKRNRERRKSRGGRKSPKKMSLVPPVDGEEPKPADATVPEEEEEEEEDDDEDYEESEDDDEEDVNRPIAHPEPTPEPKVEEPKVEEPKVEEPKVEVEVEEPKIEEPKAEEPKVEEPKSEEPKVEEPKPAAEPYVLSENAKKALEYSPSLGEDHARAVREALDRRLPLSEEAEELARMAREMLEEISQMLDREAPQIGEEETLEMRGQLAKVF